MTPEVQNVLGSDHQDAYAPPDAARLGAVEELTAGSVFVTIGDCASTAC